MVNSATFLQILLNVQWIFSSLQKGSCLCSLYILETKNDIRAYDSEHSN